MKNQIQWVRIIMLGLILIAIMLFAISMIVSLRSARQAPPIIFSGCLHVPSQYPTIVRALDAASNGECIVVSDGNYPEEIEITKSNILLLALGKVITKQIHVIGNYNVVRGFTITDPVNDAGLRVEGNHNQFVGNEIYHTKQDGVWFWGLGNQFLENYIHDILSPNSPCQMPACDEHVDCFQTWDWDWDTVGTLFDGNICIHTRAKYNGTDTSNQVFMVSGSRVKDTVIRNNILVMYDPGYSPIALYGGSGWIIANNRICNMSKAGSDAVYLSGASDVTLTANRYYGYSEFVSGGGVVSQSDNIRDITACNISERSFP